jgi:hypothetical protein
MEMLLRLERRTLAPLRVDLATAWVDEDDLERALVSAWRRVYELSKHSKQTGTRRRPTPLWHSRQADLCDIARIAYSIEQEQPNTKAAHIASRLREEAETAFAFSNQGYLRKEFGLKFGHSGTFESEDRQSANAIIMQEAREGLFDGMRRYDRHHHKGANALTYCANWARQRVFKALDRDSRLMPYKNAEPLRRRIMEAMRSLEDSSAPLDVAVIAEKAQTDIATVLRLLPNSGHVGRLDAPVREASSDGETMTIGTVIADESVNLADIAEHAALREAVARAVAEIEDPMQRTVIEMLWGLDGREVCRQSALFDGVYVDRNGDQFSAKSAIATAPHRLRNGRQVVRLRAQSRLSQALRAGEVEFVAGTPQAAELVRVAHSMGRRPWAPSSGSVQDALKRAETHVRQSAHLAPWVAGLRYRGDNEIEHSDSALTDVRDALVALGVCDSREAERLKAGKASRDQLTKGSARLLGEKHGLIDPDTGRLTSRLRRTLELAKTGADAGAGSSVGSRFAAGELQTV